MINPKLYIIQPMNGRSDAEIKAARNTCLKFLCDVFGQVREVDSFIEDLPGVPAPGREPLLYLGQSISKMAEADLVVIWGDDWEKYRECRIEREAAVAYGIPCIKVEGV